MKTSIRRTIWLSNLFLFWGYGLLQPLLPVYLSLNGLSPFEIGEIFSAGTVAASIAVLLTGRLSDVYGRKFLLVAVTAIAAIASLALLCADGFLLLLVAVVALLSFIAFVYHYIGRLQR